jgi:hypothetical protein
VVLIEGLCPVTDPEARVRFPALHEKKFSGSGTGSTHEYNRGVNR